MRFFSAFLFPAILFSLSCRPQTSQQKQPAYSMEVEEKIQQVEQNLGSRQASGNTALHYNLAGRMDFYKVKGVSIAVVHHYQLEWARGYGWADLAENRPVTTETLFQAASISKSLNAVGVLRLVQEGKLSLTEDINLFLHSWEFPATEATAGKKISVANLLSHTAGLTIHGFPGYSRIDSLPTVIQVLNGEKPANTAAVRSQFAPGLRSEYSGGGITISQLLVTDITGKPYDVYQWENVLQPMGMTHSFYTQPPPASKALVLATGYRADGAEIKGKYHIYPEMAAAGLWTNPSDLCQYIIETQLCYEGKSQKVLSPEMTRIRLTPFLDKQAALGVFIQKRGDRLYFGHGGSNEGFRCEYFGSLTDGEGVAIMVNSDDGRIIEEIFQNVAKVYGWKVF